MIKRPGQGFAINVLIEADMSHLMEHRKGNLHWILQPVSKLLSEAMVQTMWSPREVLR
jgi:hypothetical protein